MTQAVEIKTGYVPKLPRWRHQENALDAMYDREAFALFMEMRTGKTKTILDEFGEDELDRLIDQLLIVAPAGAYRTWETDAQKHLSPDLLARTKIAYWESGPTVKQRKEMREFMQYRGPRILLINVEALSTVKKARELCLQFLGQFKTTMVVDESTTIKNDEAKRTKFVVQAGRLATKRRILSGLPSPQSPLDIYSQFDFLKSGLLGYTKFSKFEQRYAIIQQKPYGPGGRMIPVTVGYTNLEELRARMAPYVFRVRLADCYDLPEKLYMRRDVEMTAEQAAAYQQMKRYAVAELENAERVTATVVMTQMLRLHQFLAGHTTSDDGNSIDISTNKIPEMLAILENVAGKAIVWAAYDADVRKIAYAIEKVYGAHSVARFWGGNRETREDEEQDFKTNPTCRFMVATAAAGGRSRTWDIADTMIYYSNTFSLEHRIQSEERNQAVGKTGNVAVFDLIVRGTIEDKIVMTLREKKELSDAITGDDWRAWIV